MLEYMIVRGDASRSRWEEWVAGRACIHLTSKRYGLQNERIDIQVIPDAFQIWLLDQDRWREAGCGHAWRDQESPQASEFVIRGVEGWPDENILAELGQLSNLTKAQEHVSSDQADTMDLLAWWIIMDRGLIPSSQDPQRTRLRVYGGLVTSHVGNAVYSGLKKRHLAYESGPTTPAVEEAYRTTFDFCICETIDYFYSGRRKVVEKSAGYRPDVGDAWGYLHRCIENYIDDLLALRDREVNVPTINIEDRFRRLLEAAYAQVDPGSGNLTEGEGTSVTDLLDAMAYDHDVHAPHRETEADPDDYETAQLQEKREIMEDAPPAAVAALLLSFTPPAAWDDIAIRRLAKDLGVPKRTQAGFETVIKSRSDRLQLAIVRVEACHEKHEYLCALRERTRDRLQKVLLSEGHSQDQAEERIRLLERQASGGEVLLGEVCAVQKEEGCPVDSQAYLAARFQELIIREKKMQGYVARYSRDWERRYMIEATEFESIAEVFCTTPEQVKQEWSELKRRLGLP